MYNDRGRMYVWGVIMKRMFFNGSIALLSGLGVARVYLYVQ